MHKFTTLHGFISYYHCRGSLLLGTRFLLGVSYHTFTLRTPCAPSPLYIHWLEQRVPIFITIQGEEVDKIRADRGRRTLPTQRNHSQSKDIPLMPHPLRFYPIREQLPCILPHPDKHNTKEVDLLGAGNTPPLSLSATNAVERVRERGTHGARNISYPPSLGRN